jgi:hypothetical protein
MPCLSQACLLGYTPSPQHAFQGDAAHQVQRRTWLTPNDSPGAWYTRRDYRSSWTLYPFHRTVFTAHTWSALPLLGPRALGESDCVGVAVSGASEQTGRLIGQVDGPRATGFQSSCFASMSSCSLSKDDSRLWKVEIHAGLSEAEKTCGTAPGREAAGCCGIFLFLPPSRASPILADKAMSRGDPLRAMGRALAPSLDVAPPGLHCAFRSISSGL